MQKRDPANVLKLGSVFFFITTLYPSQPSQPSPTKPNIYRIGNTAILGCHDCKLKDDKWFMKEHNCKGQSQSNNKESLVAGAMASNESGNVLFGRNTNKLM